VTDDVPRVTRYGSTYRGEGGDQRGRNKEVCRRCEEEFPKAQVSDGLCPLCMLKSASVESTCEVCAAVWMTNKKEARCRRCAPYAHVRRTCGCGNEYWRPTKGESAGRRFWNKCPSCRRIPYVFGKASPTLEKMRRTRPRRVKGDGYLYKYEASPWDENSLRDWEDLS
jgi:hypothetical protein